MKRYVALLGMLALALAINGCDQYSDETSSAGTGDQAALIDAGRDLFQTGPCVGCHGVNGEISVFGFSRIIKDIDDPYDLQNSLYAMRDSVPTRDPIMLAQAADLTDQQIEELAAYIATLD